MGFVLESSFGGAGVSIAVGAFFKGYFGTGFFSVQITVTLCLLCLAPTLIRASKSVPQILTYLFVTVASVGFAFPVLYALLVELFTGHYREGSGPLGAIWRVFAIVFLWICFAKVNEGYIRPALREMTFFQTSAGSVSNQSANIALGKREKALEAIKARLVPVLVRRKKAERLIGIKEPELEKADQNIARSVSLLKKGEARLAAADSSSAECGELKEEVEGLRSMVNNAEAYKLALENQIATAKQEIRECKEIGDKMQVEWTEALHINNHVEFYR